MKFYDRTAELDLIAKEIQRIKDEQKSRLMIIFGPRRIGKTALGEMALNRGGIPYVYLYCPPYALEKDLARQWLAVVNSTLNLSKQLRAKPVNGLLDIIFEEAKHRRIHVFIDEVQNLLTVNPGFFRKLSVQWDNLTVSGPSHLFLLMSTSEAIGTKILNNTGQPLYDRISATIELKPFSPAVIKEIFQDVAHKPDPEALLSLYAFTGGVPKYMETLLADGTTFEAMLETMTDPDSCLWDEGLRLISGIFKRECGSYCVILQRIAHGVGKESLLKDGLTVTSISGHLRKLETVYGLITRSRPLFAQSNRGVRRQMTDKFLNFWFYFILPHLQHVGANKVEILRSVIRSQWIDFSGRVLKQCFLELFKDSGRFSHVGEWWDGNGENEIDLIAVNVNTKTLEMIDIKRSPKDIDLTKLAAKADVFMRNTPEVKGFTYSLKGLSLESLYDDSVV